MNTATMCRKMWAEIRAQSAPLSVSAVFKRRIGMRDWAHRYARYRGWSVVLTDGAYINRYMPKLVLK